MASPYWAFGALRSTIAPFSTRAVPKGAIGLCDTPNRPPSGNHVPWTGKDGLRLLWNAQQLLTCQQMRQSQWCSTSSGQILRSVDPLSPFPVLSCSLYSSCCSQPAEWPDGPTVASMSGSSLPARCAEWPSHCAGYPGQVSTSGFVIIIAAQGAACRAVTGLCLQDARPRHRVATPVRVVTWAASHRSACVLIVKAAACKAVTRLGLQDARQFFTSTLYRMATPVCKGTWAPVQCLTFKSWALPMLSDSKCSLQSS